ncbi:MAG: D-alanyl-D-alanine dipeptidase [Sphingomonadales bacterium]
MANYRHKTTIFCLCGSLLWGIGQAKIVQAQTSYPRPEVVERMRTYHKMVRADADQQLVELSSTATGLVYEIRYASPNNFTGQALYPANTRSCYLRRPAAEALSRVAASLQKKGLGLKIFDAYRPFGVTEAFWQLIQDERYVANPAKGSGHNRGIAIDLTLIDLRTKKELEMGTSFDNFSDTAHHTFTALPDLVLQNRKLLRTEMAAEGFVALETEWWHYSLPNAKNFSLLNIPFKKLD